MLLIGLGWGATCALSLQDLSSGRVRLELLLLWAAISLYYVGGVPTLDSLVVILLFSFLAWLKKLGWGDVWWAGSACCWVPFAPFCMASGVLGCLVYGFLPPLKRGKPFIPVMTAALWLLWLAGVGEPTRL